MKVWVVVGVLLLFLSGCGSFDSGENQTFKNYRKVEISTPKEVINETINETIIENNKSEKTIPNNYTIGSFSHTRLTTQIVRQTLNEILQNYDLMIFTNVKDENYETLSDYNHLESPFVGEKFNEKKYVIKYNDNIQINNFKLYDKENYFENSPFVGEVIIGKNKYIFIVLMISEDNTQQEIKNIEELVSWVSLEYSNDNIVILGDLRADCYYYSPGLYLNNYNWLIEESDTTVGRSDCAYDRIITVKDYGDIFYNCEVDYYDQYINFDDDLNYISERYPIKCEVH